MMMKLCVPNEEMCHNSGSDEHMLLCVQAHLVAAFEQSLGNMTIRLKSVTTTAEQKVRRGVKACTGTSVRGIVCLCGMRCDNAI